MKPDQSSKFNDPLRQPFRLFDTIDQELAAKSDFWRSRMPQERLEYLEFMRCIVFGEEAVNAPIVRCYRRRKWTEAEPVAGNIVYF